MKPYAVLWHVSGFHEPNEVARWFYEDGTLVCVFDDRIEVKRCKLEVLRDIVLAHLSNGWSQFPT